MELDKATLKEPTLGPPDINPSVFDKIPKVGNFTPVEEDKLDGEDKLDDKPKDDLGDDLDTDKDKSLEKAKDDKPKDDKTPTGTDADDSVVNFFQAKFGEVEGEYTDDLDGIAAYTEKVIKRNREEAKTEGQEELFTSVPVLKALKDHLDAGYQINSFLRQQQVIDWDKIELKDKEGNLNLQLAEDIFREARRVKGVDEEEINELWATAKDSNVVEDRTKSSIAYLKKIQDSQIEEEKRKEKIQTDADKKAEVESLAEADRVLKSGNLYGVAVTADKIKELRKFSLELDKQGISERDRKIASLTIEQGLLLDMILMEDFKSFGAKPKPNTNQVDVMKKLKQQQADKKKIDLGGDGLSGGERQKINVRTIFSNQ